MGSPHLEKLLESLLSQNRETEWIEFKLNYLTPEDIGEYLSALSNSAFLLEADYGYLVFGVRDGTLEVDGTDFRFRDTKIGNQELENWLATQLEPRTDFSVDEFDYKGRRVVMIKVDATLMRPVAFRGTEYIRVGSYKKKLKDHPDKEGKIWEKARRSSFESQIALDSLNDDDVLRLLDYPKYFELMGQSLPANKTAIIEKLKEENLVRDSLGRLQITNLGAILFAKSLKDFDRLYRKAFRVIMYKGKDRLHTIKEQEGGRGYAVGFEGLIAYINDQLPTNEEIGQALRQNVKMYPEIAIRELVANTIIHQDFSETGNGPMVEIFSDRIEISNPGKPLINTLRLIDHSPKSRNEKLAYFMRRIRVCEERGTGIDKVVNAAEDFQLPAPKFIADDNNMKVVMYGPRTLRQMDREDKIRACYQHCCLKYVSNDVMTNESLRKRFEIEEKNYSIASRIIADTIEAGFIKPFDPESKSKKLARYIPIWA